MLSARITLISPSGRRCVDLGSVHSSLTPRSDASSTIPTTFLRLNSPERQNRFRMEPAEYKCCARQLIGVTAC